jgi:hypothetical protein
VPPNQIENVIKHFHQKGANKHHGWHRTFDIIKEKHAGVSEEMVREFCNKCVVCLSFTTVQYVLSSYLELRRVFFSKFIGKSQDSNPFCL